MGQTDGLKKYRDLQEGSRADADASWRERKSWRRAAKKEKLSDGANQDDDEAHKNEKVGEVVSTKMAKTIVVEVTRRVPHPLYKRIVRSARSFTRTTKSTAKVGDVVRIIECRPLSKLKRWS